jgi:hypothetical protein
MCRKNCKNGWIGINETRERNKTKSRNEFLFTFVVVGGRVVGTQDEDLLIYMLFSTLLYLLHSLSTPLGWSFWGDENCRNEMKWIGDRVSACFWSTPSLS